MKKLARLLRSLGLIVPFKREWLWVVAIATFFGLLAVSPQIITTIAAGSNHATGLPITNNVDQAAYLDVLWQARHGSVLFSNSLTPEPNAAVQLRPIFLVLGWLSALTRISPALIWNISIGFFAALLACAAYLLAAQFFAKRSERLLALTLILFGGGLGWVNFWWPGAWSITPADLSIAEATTMHAATCCAQFTWSPTLLIGITLVTWFATRRSLLAAVFAGLFSLLLVLDHPYDAPLIVLVCSLAVLVTYLKGESVRAVLSRVAGAIAGTGIGAFVVLMGLYLSPELQRWNDQNLLPPGPLLPWLAGLGVLLVFTAVGLLFRRTWSSSMLATWAILQGALIFAPLSFSRRLSEAWQIPVALLATMGILAISKRWIVRIALAATTTLFVIAFMQDLWSYSAQAAPDRVRPFFELGRWQSYPDSYREGFVWLRANSGRPDVVLASPTNGGLIVAETGLRVVAGHWAQTLDPDAKHAELADLFAGRTSLDEYEQKYSVTYLWIAREERAYLAELGRTEQDLVGSERAVFSNQDLSIYDLGKLE